MLKLSQKYYFNRDNAMTTFHPCHTFSFEDRQLPYISEQKMADPGLNILEI